MVVKPKEPSDLRPMPTPLRVLVVLAASLPAAGLFAYVLIDSGWLYQVAAIAVLWAAGALLEWLGIIPRQRRLSALWPLR